MKLPSKSLLSIASVFLVIFTQTLAKEEDQRNLWSDEEQNEIIKSIEEKFKVHNLNMDDDDKLLPHQFLHLHHMKTGGTSMDHFLKCAMERMRNDLEYKVPYYNIHECSRGAFRSCVANDDDPCREPMKNSAMMSYCAPLKHLNRFGWNDFDNIHALTVLRHPVERVWSMFRFETRMCYKCKNLTDIYDLIDRNETIGYDYLCLGQLQNHEVANLLTSDWGPDADPEDMLAEAIENMKTFFTVIGLTEELPSTVQMVGQIFPWLNTTIEGSETFCHLPHDNGSPQNNHCIREPNPDPNAGATYISKHWPLPDHPDEETRKAIEAHNQLDIRLYEKAVEYFQLQKRVFEGIGDEA